MTFFYSETSFAVHVFSMSLLLDRGGQMFTTNAKP